MSDFVKIKNLYVINSEILGSAVKFIAIIDEEVSGSTVKIRIEDSGDAIKVEDLEMTKEADRVYSYVWQSNEENDLDGEYEVFVFVENGDYKVYSTSKFFELYDDLD